MLVFGGTIMTVLAPFLNVHFLGSSLSFMMVYVWSYKNEHIQMSFLGVVNFTAPCLPWVLLVFAVLLGASPVMDMLGLLAGHLYYFLEWEYPRIRGIKVLHTPQFMRALFEVEPEPVLPEPVTQEEERNPFAPNPAALDPGPNPALGVH